MFAAKHFDPELGCDVHTYEIPPAPPTPPVPLPTPHIGMVFDPFDYLGSVSSDNPVLQAVAKPLGAVVDTMQTGLEAIGEGTRAPPMPGAPPQVPLPPGMEAPPPEDPPDPGPQPVPLGATVDVWGVKRAVAGTMGICSHIPVGIPVPPPMAPGGMQFDNEVFTGRKTVLADTDPFSFLGMLVLACNIVGMPPPPRLKNLAKPKPLSLMLPTAVVLSTAYDVWVGGIPTISWNALLGKAAMKGIGKALKGIGKGIQAALFHTIGKKVHLPPALCKIFYGHPVDIRDGSVVVENVDFELPGRLPLAWTRSYSSTEARVGACGHGWDTLADLRLELFDDGSVSFLGPNQATLFPHQPAEDAGYGDYVLDILGGVRLLREAAHWVVQTKDGLRYRFARTPQAPHRAPARDQVLLIERIADACGNHWHFERRGGRLSRIVESTAAGLAGRVIEVQTAPQGLIEAMALIDPATGARHPLVTYQYEQADLTAVTDALGASQCFAYVEHRLVRDTNRMGLSFHFAYDAQWRAVRTWGDGGLYDNHFVYDEVLHQTEITDSLGHTTVVKLDENKLPLCEIDPLGGVTVFEYDDVGRTVAVTAPEGLCTRFEYDAYGNILSTTLPDDSRISTAYNDDHKPVSITDPEGGKWHQEWDERGNLISQTTPGGAATRYEYTEQGDLRQVVDPAGQRTVLEYDPLGFLAGLTDALGQRAQFQHDARGNLLTKQLANGDTTHYRYDAKNRLIESELPDAKRITCAYDREDNLTRYRDEAGRETRFTYFCQGSLQSRTDPDGSKVEYHYDNEEQLIAVTNQKGQRWQLKRDATGRLIEEIDYWGQSRRYDYNPAGYLTRTTDPLGQVLTIACDKLGRIVSKQASDEDAETYRYNKRGQLIEAENRFSKIERLYNPDGQLIKEKQEQTDIDAGIDYCYNPAGQLLEQTQQFTHQQQEEVRFRQTQKYAYNALGQPESVQIDEHEPIRFTFDEIGRLTKQHLNEHLTQHYRYNQAGQLSNQASTFKGQLQTRIDYDYDDAGNLIRRNDSRLGVDQYRYDLLGQITSHTDPTGAIRQFVYDQTGDRFKTLKEDEQGRTLKHEDGSYWRLDKAGQLIQKRDPEGQDSFLKWDAYGRLRTFTPPPLQGEGKGGDGVGSRYEYRYDPLGRRISKTKITHSQFNTATEITWFAWDGDVMVGEVKRRAVDADTVAETDPDVTCEANPDPVIPRVAKRSRGIHTASTAQPNTNWQAQFYTYHLGSFVPLAMQVQTPKGKGVGKSLYFYQNDPNGMPVRLQDEQGEFVWEAYYSAFGQIEDFATRRIEQPLRLQGQYWDEESGLCYNLHRYYDAETGCFISADPIGLIGGLNPYQFAANTFGWIDPLGLKKSGGSHRRVRNARTGGEVHHMPAFQSYRDLPDTPSHGAGPSIWMEGDDHRKTRSWGSSNAARQHRAQQAAHIRAGDWASAIEMDIKDIRAQFGSTYDAKIKKMLNYAKQQGLISSRDARRLNSC